MTHHKILFSCSVTTSTIMTREKKTQTPQGLIIKLTLMFIKESLISSSCIYSVFIKKTKPQNNCMETVSQSYQYN